MQNARYFILVNLVYLPLIEVIFSF